MRVLMVMVAGVPVIVGNGCRRCRPPSPEEDHVLHGVQKFFCVQPEIEQSAEKHVTGYAGRTSRYSVFMGYTPVFFFPARRPFSILPFPYSKRRPCRAILMKKSREKGGFIHVRSSREGTREPVFRRTRQGGSSGGMAPGRMRGEVEREDGTVRRGTRKEASSREAVSRCFFPTARWCCTSPWPPGASADASFP